MIIDSHCHLNMKDFTPDLSDIIKNAKNNDINGMLTISTKIEEFKNISNIAKNNKNIWYSLGIHPHNVNNNYKDLQVAIDEFKSDEKFIGIGETGLDYFYENSSKKLQIESFINHIELSRSTDLPIIIHTRDADKDTISILKDEYKKKPFKGLIHCFTATEELALVLHSKHPLSNKNELLKEDLYKLSFVTLDSQSTTRKVVDKLLQDSGLDIQRLKIEMELNSLEAIKNAVQSGLGASFLPVVSIERELAAGTIHKAYVADLEVKRELKLITNPSRYTSRASEVFKKNILPQFASLESPLRQI